MKAFLLWVSIGCILLCGITAALDSGRPAPAADPAEEAAPVYEFQLAPDSPGGPEEDAAGQDPAEMPAIGAAASALSDVRAFTALGAGFLLITAAAGSTAVLSACGRKEKEGEGSFGD